MSLYNLRLLAPNRYAMAKFDADFNVEAVYNLEPKGPGYTCDCPANARSVVLKPCKHKRMIPLMLGAVNTDRFYDPETRSWCQPLAGFEEAIANVDPNAITEGLAALEAEGRQGSEQEPPAYGKPDMTLANAMRELEPYVKASLGIEPKGSVTDRITSDGSHIEDIERVEVEPPAKPLGLNVKTEEYIGINVAPKPSAAPTIRRR